MGTGIKRGQKTKKLKLPEDGGYWMRSGLDILPHDSPLLNHTRKRKRSTQPSLHFEKNNELKMISQDHDIRESRSLTPKQTFGEYQQTCEFKDTKHAHDICHQCDLSQKFRWLEINHEGEQELYVCFFCYNHIKVEIEPEIPDWDECE